MGDFTNVLGGVYSDRTERKAGVRELTLDYDHFRCQSTNH